jgi:hypothetical protein
MREGSPHTTHRCGFADSSAEILALSRTTAIGDRPRVSGENYRGPFGEAEAGSEPSQLGQHEPEHHFRCLPSLPIDLSSPSLSSRSAASLETRIADQGEPGVQI